MDKNLRFEKKTEKARHRAPYIVFYSIAGAFLAFGVGLIITILLRKCFGLSDNSVDVLLGVATALFSAGILSNAIGTFLSSFLNNRSVLQQSRVGRATDYIEIFNSDILNEYAITKSVLTSLNDKIKLSILFEPLLSNQGEKIAAFEKQCNKRKIDYEEELLVSCCKVFYAINELLNEPMMKMCSAIIKDSGEKKSLDKFKNTIGEREIMRIFSQKRIKVLNYFEKMAIAFMNDNVDRTIIYSQFGDVIRQCISLFYYSIYNCEGLSSYPTLAKMCEVINELYSNNAKII